MSHLPIFQLDPGQAKRGPDVGREAIRSLLLAGTVRFVIEDPIMPLSWQDESHSFDFWKHEVQSHLAEPDQRVYLEEWPGEYAYYASQWDDGGTPIIVLKKIH